MWNSMMLCPLVVKYCYTSIPNTIIQFRLHFIDIQIYNNIDEHILEDTHSSIIQSSWDFNSISWALVGVSWAIILNSLKNIFTTLKGLIFAILSLWQIQTWLKQNLSFINTENTRNSHYSCTYDIFYATFGFSKWHNACVMVETFNSVTHGVTTSIIMLICTLDILHCTFP